MVNDWGESFDIRFDDGTFEAGIAFSSAYVAGTISLAVMVQTYDSMEDNAYVLALDNVILVIFSLEVVLKVASEGTRPYRYFTGPEWRWNNFEYVGGGPASSAQLS